MNTPIESQVEELLNKRPTVVYDLIGGCVGDVKRLRFEDDSTLVIKLDEAGTGGLAVEGRMLSYLSEHSELSVPDVVVCNDHMLIMTDLGGSTGARGKGQVQAARQLAALHLVKAEQYGLDFDTRIGGLVQKNTPSDSWPAFFRDQRILGMATQAAAAGNLPDVLYDRIRDFAEIVEEELVDPNPPALIHGDVWAGNILAKPKELLGFIDPAIYYADPEVELAFINLFSTFSAKFFDIYKETHEIHDDFRERRQHVYNLYPLLVHVTIFGGGYIEQLSNHLGRLEE